MIQPYLFFAGRTDTFFAKAFGMVTDKFGVGWMMIAGAKQPG